MIFISYTLRGEDLNVDKLSIILKENSGQDPYIDYLHNVKLDDSLWMEQWIECSPSNLKSKAQKYLEEQLVSAKALYVLESDKSAESEWVQYEIALARQYKIPVVFIEKSTWKNWI